MSVDVKTAVRRSAPGSQLAGRLDPLGQHVFKERAFYYFDYMDSITARNGYDTFSMQMH